MAQNVDIWNYFLLKAREPTPSNCPLTYDTPVFTPEVTTQAAVKFPSSQLITCPSLESIYGRINGLYLVTITSDDNTINIGVLMTTRNTQSGYFTRIIVPFPFSTVATKFVNNGVALPFFWSNPGDYLLPDSTLIVALTTTAQPQCEVKVALWASW